MGTFDEYLIDEKDCRVEIAVGLGKASARLDGKKIFDQQYVTGDMEDKLFATVRCYKAIVTKLLAEDGK